MPEKRSPRAREAIAFIAANVRHYRRLRGLTQEQLAELVDVPPLRVQRVERGQADVRVGLLVDLAAALRVALGRLLRPRDASVRAPGRPKTKRARPSTALRRAR